MAMMKMGRKRPDPQAKRLMLKDYLTGASLPTPPTSCDYSTKGQPVLSNVYLNDQLGDCVIAGGYHVVGVETGNAGSLFTASSAQIVSDYSAIGGYVPGDPNTDNGCNEITAMNYWQNHGFANGTKILGWLSVDGTNKSEIELAMYLFENLFFGIELPDAWISPFPSGNGFVWDVAGNANPNNGHAVIGTGYNANGVQIDSWGMIGTLTWGAIAKYCAAGSGGEVHFMLTPDQLAKGQTLAPNGIDWPSLVADFDAMGGNVPVPQPPTPPPSPNPQAITLQQAEQWATAYLKTGACVMTKNRAISLVIAALTANWPK